MNQVTVQFLSAAAWTRRAAATGALCLLLAQPVLHAQNSSQTSPQDPLITTPASRQVQTLMSAGKDKEAYDAAKSQVAVSPNSAEAHYMLGSAASTMAQKASMFSALGYAKELKAAFIKAAELDPKHVAARSALVQFHLAAPGIAGGDKAQIPVLLTQIKALDPAAGLRLEGNLKLSQKDFSGAEKLYLQALDANPKDVNTVEVLASLYFKDKRFPEATKLIDSALLAQPESPMLQYQRAKLSALNGDQLEPALVILDKLIAMKPAPARISIGGAYWRRGQILERLNRLPEAIASMEKAVALEASSKEMKADLARLRKVKG